MGWAPNLARQGSNSKILPARGGEFIPQSAFVFLANPEIVAKTFDQAPIIAAPYEPQQGRFVQRAKGDQTLL